MMGNAFGPGGSIIDMNEGGQGGPRAGRLWGAQATTPAAPLNATPSSGPQLAPGQTFYGQTLPSGTAAKPDDEEAKQRLLAAQAPTILGDSDVLGGSR